MGNRQQLIDDLRTVFHAVPGESLEHLRRNRHRLVRGTYRTDDGRGCIMYLLTETLPRRWRIDSKKALTRFFGQGDPDSPQYQPAKWIVRLWDRQICSEIHQRYGPDPDLDVETVMRVLDEVIAERIARDSSLEDTSEEAPEPIDTNEPADLCALAV